MHIGIIGPDGVEGVAFGTHPSVVRSRFGDPIRETLRLNNTGLELHYPSCIFRYDESSLLVEVAMWEPAIIELDSGSEPFVWRRESLDAMKGLWSHVFVHGFTVFPARGIAMDGFDAPDDEEKTLVLFASGGWDHLIAEVHGKQAKSEQETAGRRSSRALSEGK